MQPIKVMVVLIEKKAAWTVNTTLLFTTADGIKGAPDTAIVLPD